MLSPKKSYLISSLQHEAKQDPKSYLIRKPQLVEASGPNNRDALVILGYLGGWDSIRIRFKVKHFILVANGVQFKFQQKKRKKPNLARIVYSQAKDAYEVEFYRTSLDAYPKLLAKHSNVTASDLRKVFERETGLFLPESCSGLTEAKISDKEVAQAILDQMGGALGARNFVYIKSSAQRETW